MRIGGCAGGGNVEIVEQSCADICREIQASETTRESATCQCAVVDTPYQSVYVKMLTHFNLDSGYVLKGEVVVDMVWVDVSPDCEEEDEDDGSAEQERQCLATFAIP